MHIKHRKFINETQKAVNSCFHVGRQMVWSKEGLILGDILILAFVYVLLFLVKWRRKKQSGKRTTWAQPHFSTSSTLQLPKSSHLWPTPACRPISTTATASRGAAILHSVRTKASISCPAARSIQGPQILGGGKSPQVKALWASQGV